MITGERVTTDSGGFNPTYQRHVAAYRLCAPLLPAGRVLDLGCGIGHSYRELAPRDSIGVDLDAGALAGQERETVRADMRRLPFADRSFASVLSVQSIEHVPDPDAVLLHAAVGGVARLRGAVGDRAAARGPRRVRDPQPTHLRNAR